MAADLSPSNAVDASGPAIVDIAPSAGSNGRCLVWRFDRPMIAISSAVVGGGIGRASWVLNMTVDSDYARLDPADHLLECAHRVGLTGPGIGLMTAVDVGAFCAADVHRASVVATVGVRRPVWAATVGTHPPPLVPTPHRVPPSPVPPGTINLVATVPVGLSSAALVNAVATITEAKVQAVLDEEIEGTGTASDAVCVVCTADDDAEPFGGPRSTWGGRLADATYLAVRDGIARQRS